MTSKRAVAFYHDPQGKKQALRAGHVLAPCFGVDFVAIDF
jgi:hypothetical protein